MKEIKNRQMKIKFVEVQNDEFEIVTTYKTDDGRIFDNRYNAEEHEKRLKYDAINKVDFIFPRAGDIWYIAKNKEELNFLKEYFSDEDGKNHGAEKIKVGEWFTVYIDCSNFYLDRYYFLTLNELNQTVYELTNILMDKE